VVNPVAGSTTDVDWQVVSISEQGTLQGDGERGMELFDCDGDGDLDSVTAVSNAGDQNFYINVNLNGGSGLIPGPNQFFTQQTIGTDASFPSVLDTGDFNGDGILDVAMANDGDDTDSLAICYGDGTLDDCSFTCSLQVDLEALTGFNADPTSLEAADFDGDGDPDVAIVLRSSDALGYFFNNGSGAATGPNFSAAASQLIDTLPPSNNAPFAVVSGFFNLDDVPDAAVTNNGPSFFPVVPITFLKGGTQSVPGNVVVINSDGAGGFLPVEPLSLPVSAVSGVPFANPDAIDAKDFDHCGGDDIVALAEGPLNANEVSKYAAFWYNVDEPPVVTAVTPLTGDVDEVIPVTATCSDPTDDDRSFSWTIVGPAGSTSSITPSSGALIGTAVDIAGNFQGDTPGDYTLTLSCVSCDLSATTTVLITLNQQALFTQGGCLASLTPNGGSNVKWSYMVLLALPLFLALRRFGRKGAIVLVAAATLMGFAVPASALTTSFSVNTFEPTVDDSEYFTIYNSPTMLQRNFHVGFYLD
ncbi:VCBS repeat-containing protein, partial [bacterium]